MFAVVYNLLGHASVDADVLACDEACFVAAKKEHHLSDVLRIAHTTTWLLGGIGTFKLRVVCIYPAGRYGIYTDFRTKTDCKSVSEGGDSALCCRVTLSLRHTHSVS